MRNQVGMRLIHQQLADIGVLADNHRRLRDRSVACGPRGHVRAVGRFDDIGCTTGDHAEGQDGKTLVFHNPASGKAHTRKRIRALGWVERAKV